jgi:hypothetical protein
MRRIKPYLKINCNYCQQEFLSIRADKKYCSPSCRQMGYIQRKKGITPFSNNTSIDTRELEGLLHQVKSQSVNSGINSSVNLHQVSHQNHQVKCQVNHHGNDFMHQLKDKEYPYHYCQWMKQEELGIVHQFAELEFCELEDHFKEKKREAIWVSIRLRSLIESLLILSEMFRVKKDDLIELCNAFTLLIQSKDFKKVEDVYCYATTTKNTRNQLRNFLLTEQREEFLFRLRPEIKQNLIICRYKLASFFIRRPFKELSFD